MELRVRDLLHQTNSIIAKDAHEAKNILFLALVWTHTFSRGLRLSGGNFKWELWLWQGFERAVFQLKSFFSINILQIKNFPRGAARLAKLSFLKTYSYKQISVSNLNSRAVHVRKKGNKYLVKVRKTITTRRKQQISSYLNDFQSYLS